MTLIADWMQDHAIDMQLAHDIGLRGEDNTLRAPYRTAAGSTFHRSRKFPSGVWLQPAGIPLQCWWPLGRAYGMNVLVTEGEGDTLAAASILNRDDDERLNGLCPVGLPGTAATKACAAELAATKTRLAYICLDADEAGRKATDKLCTLLHSVGVVPMVCELPEGYDLAERLSELAVWSRPDALYRLLTKATPRPPTTPNIRSQARTSQYTASDGSLRDIPAAIYVQKLADIEEPREGQLVHCPLHDDSTASFRVNGNLYHCFGCLGGGSIFDFAMELWDCEFKEARERLGEMFEVAHA